MKIHSTSTWITRLVGAAMCLHLTFIPNGDATPDQPGKTTRSPRIKLNGSSRFPRGVSSAHILRFYTLRAAVTSIDLPSF